MVFFSVCIFKLNTNSNSTAMDDLVSIAKVEIRHEKIIIIEFSSSPQQLTKTYRKLEYTRQAKIVWKCKIEANRKLINERLHLGENKKLKKYKSLGFPLYNVLGDCIIAVKHNSWFFDINRKLRKKNYCNPATHHDDRPILICLLNVDFDLKLKLIEFFCKRGVNYTWKASKVGNWEFLLP